MKIRRLIKHPNVSIRQERINGVIVVQLSTLFFVTLVGCVSTQSDPLLAARFAVESTCQHYHTVDAYLDGSIRYQAHQRTVSGDILVKEVVVAEDSYKLSHSEFLRMVDLVNGFQLLPTQGLPSDIDENPGPTYIGSAAPDLMLQLREFLDTSLALDWHQFTTDGKPCKPAPYQAGSGLQIKVNARSLVERQFTNN